MYPNPAKQQLNFTLPSRTSRIEIYTTQGKLVLAENTFTTKKFTLDISSLSNGSYIVHAMDRTGYSAKKLLVEKGP